MTYFNVSNLIDPIGNLNTSRIVFETGTADRIVTSAAVTAGYDILR